MSKIVDKHTCSSTNLQPNDRQENIHLLGEYIANVLFEDYSRVYCGGDIVNDMNVKLKISITYHQVWCAKQYALFLLRGTKEDSFTKLTTYFHNLVKHNLDTVTHIQTYVND